ncbi:MAG: hypothetical protein A2293_11050 [Elusimicrobia bacterium RIFOXYB2_FULL_49_7]|nr:MAG: hypothetical protein A2293_11050 [Elusimicrobia bacterium RIFOXYB2_FULL_49_7]
MESASLKYLVQGFQGEGGIYMWGILVIAMIAWAMAIERIYFIFIKSSMGRAKFMSDLYKLIKAGDFAKALKFSSSYELPIAKIMSAILVNKETGKDEMDKAFNEVFLTDVPRMQRYTPLLVVLANVATLLGLLGTIFGLLLAFDAVANVPAAQRAQALATGIAIAMATTFFGLVVAIPLLVANGVIASHTDRLIEEMDEKSSKMINTFLKKD